MNQLNNGSLIYLLDYAKENPWQAALLAAELGILDEFWKSLPNGLKPKVHPSLK